MGSVDQPGDEVDGTPHDHHAEHIRQDSVGKHDAPDPGIAHRRVRHLVGPADRERDIGEVTVVGPLLPDRVTKTDARGSRSEVQVGVAQAVDRVDPRPRQHDGQHRDADEQQPLCAALPPGKAQGETDTQEAGDARPDQQPATTTVRGQCVSPGPSRLAELAAAAWPQHAVSVAGPRLARL
jgi:hypothetical protein